MHVFHFLCIAANVRHGSVTCPIYRAQWSHLPRELTIPSITNSDPILRILDDSIATSRFNRRSFLCTTRYNDDDPVELEATAEVGNRCLRLTVIPAVPRTDWQLPPTQPPPLVRFPSTGCLRKGSGRLYKSSMIGRIFYLGEAEPAEGLRKGLKILEDRTHHNPLAYILHISDSPTRSYICRDLQFPIPIHRFHIGFGFGMSSGLVMHEFEEFLARLLGGARRETQLRIGAEGGWILLGDLRGGEEKRFPLDLVDDCGLLSVSHSYVEGGGEQRLSTGEVVVAAEKNDQNDGCRSEIGGGDPGISTGSSHSIQRWGYLDPFMARRWAKHLHGCKA